MKKLLFCFSILVCGFFHSQKGSVSTFVDVCYLPNGEKCPKEFYKKNMTYGEFQKNFEKKGRVWDAYVTDKLVTVMFKSFTKIPLCIMVSDDKDYSSDRIKEFINMVNENNVSYSYYFGQEKYGIKADIERFIKEKVLDKAFLIDTLGDPTAIKSSLFGGKPADCFIYDNDGFRIYFVNDIAIGYDEI
ncbi:hypothetical protein EGY05_08355 [Chryseobacterium arthrosphaerae]|uniref:hypothetical protein n=1 Tax=Chryseobacterium arthrosphaerae TaxID=651561 RepID=UPI000F4F85E9|nr:hypothetical protein [Chryseobacterium arthrosphaerae]AYZ11936.1 hypothetical protein EGY05_08355 [Chryseobacterium arthrosphaerae]